MSLFDILSAVSIDKNVNDANSRAAKVLKKIDSATLTILNGEALTYTNIGGRTGNTFGVNNNFQFDVEVFLDALIHTDSTNKWKKGLSGLGSFLLGPGSANNVTVGNRTSIDWMPKSVHNFSVIRGGKPYTFLYGNELDDKYGKGFNDTSTVFNIALIVFSAVIFGYDLWFNLAGQFNCGADGGGLLTPVGDPKYIAKKQAEIAANEKEQEELKEISAQQAASGTILSPDALEKQQHDQEHLKHNYDELEESLKKAEKEKEWSIWTNIVIENKGIWVLKMLEGVKGSFVQVAKQIEKAKENVEIMENNLSVVASQITDQELELQSPLILDQTIKDAIENEIADLNNRQNQFNSELIQAKKVLQDAEDRLTFLKPPA
jgi:hypothetical protein